MRMSSIRCLPRNESELVRGIVLRCSSRRTASTLSYPEIDSKWQKIWRQERKIFDMSSSAQLNHAYILPMFAYPSGSLHMGHLRVYTISDVIARYKRMRGYNVLHPTGWDAFGLPAENAAIERGIDPAVWTEHNIKKMRDQLKSFNTSFDWDAEISTCSPAFYKHTQRLFLMLYERGLAYQAKALVNWDPVDQTVLANEQVDSNGRSWRSGAQVEQKNLKQWFFRITHYADKLAEGIENLAETKQWPERVLMQQRNWLGQSRGSLINFDLRYVPNREVRESEGIESGDRIPRNARLRHALQQRFDVFTTRADTILGVKYLALAVSHPIVQAISHDLPDLRKFVSGGFDQDSKDGFLLPLIARSPIEPDRQIPVYAAPYVVSSYGSGAVMGVPAHDDRDLAFWKVHRPQESIPIVIELPAAPLEKTLVAPSELDEAQTSRGLLSVQCGRYSGMTSDDFITLLYKEAIAETSSSKRKARVRSHTNWRLRDWLISRQRYWGTPIPIIHCKTCGTVPVPQEELPVCLPKLEASAKGRRGNPLETASEWVNCKCPRCSAPSRRETDTMDTFVDSSWYFARFPDAHNNAELFSADAAKKMLPVDVYVGGVEHAILHLLYARFVYKFLTSRSLVFNITPKAKDRKSSAIPIKSEPFRRLVAQGMVHGKTFSDPATGRFLRPEEVVSTENGFVIQGSGVIPDVSWEKMSKSKHNGVDPGECIAKYGADTTRAHMLFAAPVSETLQWDEQKIVGIQRWFRRIQRLVDKVKGAESPRLHGFVKIEEIYLSEDHSKPLITTAAARLLLLAHETIHRVTHVLEDDTYSLNTVISDLTKLTNALDDANLNDLVPRHYQIMVSSLLRMLAPIAPAFMEECWEEFSDSMPQKLGKTIFRGDAWPEGLLKADAEAAVRGMLKEMTCVVQVNGKMRFSTQIMKPEGGDGGELSQIQTDEILSSILETQDGVKWLQERNTWDKRKKVIVVKGGQLVNVVF